MQGSILKKNNHRVHGEKAQRYTERFLDEGCNLCVLCEKTLRSLWLNGMENGKT